MERVVLLMTKEMKERLTKEAEADRRSISNYIITHYIEKVALQTQAPATQGLGEIKVIEKEVIKEVDSVVSKLPKPVLDFYQEQALDRDGDLINCLVKNLIERAINSGVKLSEDSSSPATMPAGGIKTTEILEEQLSSIAKANQKLAELDKKKQNTIPKEEIERIKKEIGL
jgi:hypothetical protein